MNAVTVTVITTRRVHRKSRPIRFLHGYTGPDGKLYSVVCLPPPATLDRLALTQADVGHLLSCMQISFAI